MGHLVKDCTKCFELIDESGTVAESLLSYGDWLRATNDSQQNKTVGGVTVRTTKQVNLRTIGNGGTRAAGAQVIGL